MIGILAAHPAELFEIKKLLTDRRIYRGVTYGRLRGVSVALVSLGQGSRRAEASLSRFLEMNQCRGVVITGFAGATHPDLSVGDMLVPDEVFDLRETEDLREDLGYKIPMRLTDIREAVSGRSGGLGTVSQVVIEPADKERIGEDNHVIAVDMETAAVAAQAQIRGLPWIVARVVLDPMHRPLGVVSWYHAVVLVISVKGWGRLVRFGIDLVSAQRRLGENVGVVVEWMQRVLDKRTENR